MSLCCKRLSLVASVTSLLLVGCATISSYDQPYYDSPYDRYRPYERPYPGREAAYEQGYRDAERARSSQNYYNPSNSRDYERGYERGKKESKREAKERSRERPDYRPAQEYRPPADSAAPAPHSPARGTFGTNDG